MLQFLRTDWDHVSAVQRRAGLAELVDRGYSRRELARALNVSEGTVRYCLRRVKIAEHSRFGPLSRRKSAGELLRGAGLRRFILGRGVQRHCETDRDVTSFRGRISKIGYRDSSNGRFCWCRYFGLLPRRAIERHLPWPSSASSLLASAVIAVGPAVAARRNIFMASWFRFASR